MIEDQIDAAAIMKSFNDISDQLNAKIDGLAKNMTDGLKQVSNNCLRWFTQLKGHVDQNAADIVQIKRDVEQLKREQGDVAELRRENEQLKRQVSDLEKDAEYKTSHAFRLQLVIYNLEEEENENVWDVVRDFMVNNLRIQEQQVDHMPMRDMHRMGKKAENKVRPIVMAFLMQRDRDFTLKQAKNLRNTNLSLSPHLSSKMVDVKKGLLAIRKDIKENHDRRILAFIGYRSYRPVLLVKVAGKIQEYKRSMPINTLQHSDHQDNRDNHDMGAPQEMDYHGTRDAALDGCCGFRLLLFKLWHKFDELDICVDLWCLVLSANNTAGEEGVVSLLQPACLNPAC